MFKNNIGAVPNPVRPIRPNPANPVGKAPVALGQPAAPNHVANGQMPANGNAPSPSPILQSTASSFATTVQFERKSMGALTYHREVARTPDADVKHDMPVKLFRLIGDLTKVSFHRVMNNGLSTGASGPYQFIGRDPQDSGRAMIDVETSGGHRAVYEVSFHFKALPLLAKEAHKAPKL